MTTRWWLDRALPPERTQVYGDGERISPPLAANIPTSVKIDRDGHKFREVPTRATSFHDPGAGRRQQRQPCPFGFRLDLDQGEAILWLGRTMFRRAFINDLGLTQSCQMG